MPVTQTSVHNQYFYMKLIILLYFYYRFVNYIKVTILVYCYYGYFNYITIQQGVEYRTLS